MLGMQIMEKIIFGHFESQSLLPVRSKKLKQPSNAWKSFSECQENLKFIENNMYDYTYC